MVVNVERGFFPAEGSEDRISRLCFEAREVLGAYMLADCELEPLGEAEEGAEEAYELVDADDGIYPHETPALKINEQQSALLGNTPQVTTENGGLSWLFLPGYVSLRIGPDQLSGPTSQRSRARLCDQLVFRTPNDIDEAAIFHGYELTDATAISADEVPKLKRIGFLIACMRRGYREIISQSPGANNETYLSQTPVLPASMAMEEILRGQA